MGDKSAKEKIKERLQQIKDMKLYEKKEDEKKEDEEEDE